MWQALQLVLQLGALPPLLALGAQGQQPDAQLAAAKCLAALTSCGGGLQAVQALAGAGVVRLLAQLLDSADLNVAYFATYALDDIRMADQPLLVAEEEAIVSKLPRLLCAPEPRNLQLQASALHLLRGLTSNKPALRPAAAAAISAAGALGHLVELAAGGSAAAQGDALWLLYCWVSGSVDRPPLLQRQQQQQQQQQQQATMEAVQQLGVVPVAVAVLRAPASSNALQDLQHAVRQVAWHWRPAAGGRRCGGGCHSPGRCGGSPGRLPAVPAGCDLRAQGAARWRSGGAGKPDRAQQRRRRPGGGPRLCHVYAGQGAAPAE
jgi:hypothetical protein